jgi:oxepin-CoA hydrolase/3-oxo-5,6-dehydrosuberyl-CoA semialdehyde dehydrogenase
MKTAQLLNYSLDQWQPGDSGSLADIASAIDGSLVARTGSGGLDFAGMLNHARTVGGPALR